MIKCFKKKGGFTLPELLVVMGIMILLFGIGSSNYFGYRNKKFLESSTVQIVTDLREIMERSRSQQSGSQWGVRFTNPSGDANDYYEIWSGDTYASGTVASKIPLPSSVVLSAPPSSSSTDIIFSKATGLPTATFTIVMITSSGSGTSTIDISSAGVINYVINSD